MQKFPDYWPQLNGQLLLRNAPPPKYKKNDNQQLKTTYIEAMKKIKSNPIRASVFNFSIKTRERKEVNQNLMEVNTLVL